MNKSILMTMLVVFIAFTGISFSLMQMYSSPDGNSYPFNASLIYLGTSIFMFTFLLTLKQNLPKPMKWVNILLILMVGILALLLALICLYAAPIENKIYPLASAIFVVSGLVSLNGIFMVSKFNVEISDKIEQKS